MQLPFLRQPLHIQKAIAKQSQHVFPEDTPARAYFSVGLIDVPSSAHADLRDVALESKEHGFILDSYDYKVFLKPCAQLLRDPLYRHYAMMAGKRLNGYLKVSEIAYVLEGWPSRLNEWIPDFMDSLTRKHSGTEEVINWEGPQRIPSLRKATIEIYKEKYVNGVLALERRHYDFDERKRYLDAHKRHLARRQGLSDLLREKMLARRVEHFPAWRLIPYEECRSELISGQECVFSLEKFADLREPVLWYRGDTIAVAEYALLKKWLADNPTDPATRQPLDYSQLFRAS